MDSLPVGLLPILLRNHARGIHATEAAVGLLVDHGHWIGRTDFQTDCVRYDPQARTAWIDWPAAAEFVEIADCGPTEDRVLRFAAELAGQNTGSRLPELLCGLDDRTSRLVVDAVRAALGAIPGATVACSCGHRIPATAYTAHQHSPRHAGPGGACLCGRTAPHDITPACLGRPHSDNGDGDNGDGETTGAET